MTPLDRPDAVPRTKVLEILIDQTNRLARIEGQLEGIWKEHRATTANMNRLRNRVDKLEPNVQKLIIYATLAAGVVAFIVDGALKYIAK